MKKMILFLSGLLFFASACDKDDSGIRIFTVGSEMVYRRGLFQECPYFVVKEKNDKNWKVLPIYIQDFDYERGYEYVVMVVQSHVAHPPQDDSNMKINLLQVISKVRRDSENLPPIHIDYPYPQQ